MVGSGKLLILLDKYYTDNLTPIDKKKVGCPKPMIYMVNNPYRQPDNLKRETVGRILTHSILKLWT